MRDRWILAIFVGIVGSGLILLWLLAIEHDCHNWALDKAPLAQFSLEDKYYHDCLVANNIPTFPSITLPAEN